MQTSLISRRELQILSLTALGLPHKIELQKPVPDFWHGLVFLTKRERSSAILATQLAARLPNAVGIGLKPLVAQNLARYVKTIKVPNT